MSTNISIQRVGKTSYRPLRIEKKLKNKNKRRQLVRAPHIKRSARRLAPSQLGSCAHIEHSREERETRGFSSLLRLLSAEMQRERSNLDRE